MEGDLCVALARAAKSPRSKSKTRRRRRRLRHAMNRVIHGRRSNNARGLRQASPARRNAPAVRVSLRGTGLSIPGMSIQQAAGVLTPAAGVKGCLYAGVRTPAAGGLCPPYRSWAVVYDITQTYDKNGNRSSYDKNVAGGQSGNFGRSENLQYTYDNNNRLTLITDSDDATYNCIVTPDANGNITQIEEQGKFGATVQSTLTQEFQYDDLNRMTSYKTTRYDSVAAKTKYVRRQHEYDATGRLVNSTLKQWETGQAEPGGDYILACCGGKCDQIGNDHHREGNIYGPGRPY